MRCGGVDIRSAAGIKEDAMKNVLAFIMMLVSFANIAHSQIYATFSGDTTKIWDANFGWACGGRLFPITSASNDTIYITECDTLQHATCGGCSLTVCTSFIGLNAGTYTAIITRQWKFHITYPRDTIIGYTIDAGSVTFTVLNPPSLPKSVAFYHSGCLGSGQGAADENTAPNSFAMLANYPNPFNPSTRIRYTIPRQCRASLKIYNSTGQYVSTLFEENRSAGTYEINFDGHALSSGVYLCRLNIGEQTLSSKIILIK
jgi:hypothetical protein